MMRTCKKCGVAKTLENFEVNNSEKGWRRWECKACVAARVKTWNEKSKDHIRAYKQEYHQEHRAEIIAKVNDWVAANPEKRRDNALSYYYRLQHSAILAYGGYQCACCGEREPLFLSLDHMNGDGGAHRRQLGTLGGARLYKDLRDRGWPSGFQVLCMNCNHGRHRNGGICPHHAKA